MSGKDYPCEACMGLVPEMRRTKCLGCSQYYCEHHIDNHNCNNALKRWKLDK